MALLDKMSVDDLMRVKKMVSSEAETFLKKFNLTASEMSQAKALVMVRDKHHDSRLWLATAWMLGASFSMLAKDKGVTKQSIMNQVDKLIPVDERAKGRVGGNLSFEAMGEYKVKYFSNLDQFGDMGPKEVAAWLINHTSLDQ